MRLFRAYYKHHILLKKIQTSSNLVKFVAVWSVNFKNHKLGDFTGIGSVLVHYQHYFSKFGAVVKLLIDPWMQSCSSSKGLLGYHSKEYRKMQLFRAPYLIKERPNKLWSRQNPIIHGQFALEILMPEILPE